MANPQPWPDGVVCLRAYPPQWGTVMVRRGRWHGWVALDPVLVPGELLTRVGSDHKGAPHAASQRQEPRSRPSSGLHKVPPLLGLSPVLRVGGGLRTLRVQAVGEQLRLCPNFSHLRKLGVGFGATLPLSDFS